MKKIPPLTRRSYLILICLILVFALAAAPFFKSRIMFSQITQNYWESQLIEDTLSMHYTVSKPEDWGLGNYKALLRCYSANEQAASLKELDQYISYLSDINSAKLSECDRLTYTLLYQSMMQEAALLAFSHYQEPLSPGSGAQNQLPILLAEYRFNCERDVQDYLSILSDFGPYMDALGVYETEKAEAGLFMSDACADKLIAQCDAIMDRETLLAGNHFLQATFTERLNALCLDGLLSERSKESYVSENNRILVTLVEPAYDRLADTLFLLKGSGQNEGGLAGLPQGRDYYALLLKQQSGSSLSVEELKQLLLTRFEDDCDMLEQLTKEALDTLPASSANDPMASLTAEEILHHLQQSMQQDFPAFPSMEEAGAQPACTVKTVSQSLSSYTAPAFYLTPPLDDVSSNVIYINRRSTPQGLSLYTTLAHEGYPGHLYQSVYYNLHREDASILPVRSLLYYGGYVEGWALYVENISYDYAKKLLPDSRQQLSCSLTRLDRDMQLCLYSLLDIAIHYDGASYEKVHSILQRFGLSDPAVTRSIYEYIVEEPANYPKYYIGYLEILNLREAARERWGDSYSEKKFHTFFLEAGPCDFATLHSLLAS